MTQIRNRAWSALRPASFEQPNPCPQTCLLLGWRSPCLLSVSTLGGDRATYSTQPSSASGAAYSGSPRMVRTETREWNGRVRTIQGTSTSKCIQRLCHVVTQSRNTARRGTVSTVQHAESHCSTKQMPHRESWPIQMRRSASSLYHNAERTRLAAAGIFAKTGAILGSIVYHKRVLLYTM